MPHCIAGTDSRDPRCTVCSTYDWPCTHAPGASNATVYATYYASSAPVVAGAGHTWTTTDPASQSLGAPRIGGGFAAGPNQVFSVRAEPSNASAVIGDFSGSRQIQPLGQAAPAKCESRVEDCATFFWRLANVFPSDGRCRMRELHSTWQISLRRAFRKYRYSELRCILLHRNRPVAIAVERQVSFLYLPSFRLEHGLP